MTRPEEDTAVVIGGGTMGAGIAQCLVEVGVAVTLVDATEEATAAARSRVEDGLRRRHKSAADPEAAVAADLSRLSVAAGLPGTGLPRVALVVEAVPEDPDLKRAVLARAEAACPGALVASNTSSLSIDGLAGGLRHPSRFCGLHFFNPVPRSALVEIVVGSATAPESVEEARDWVARLGKEAIVVGDTPGFATSRLGVCIGLEAIRMVEEGVASPADIDRGMVLAYKFPMGPLELTDLVGLDVRLAIAEHLAATLGPRFEPPRLLRHKVAAGHLGKKTGQGFYDWAGPDAPGPAPTVQFRSIGDGATPVSPQVQRQRMAMPPGTVSRPVIDDSESSTRAP